MLNWLVHISCLIIKMCDKRCEVYKSEVCALVDVELCVVHTRAYI
jgi:hypothetical protein